MRLHEMEEKEFELNPKRFEVQGYPRLVLCPTLFPPFLTASPSDFTRGGKVRAD